MVGDGVGKGIVIMVEEKEELVVDWVVDGGCSWWMWRRGRRY